MSSKVNIMNFPYIIIVVAATTRKLDPRRIIRFGA